MNTSNQSLVKVGQSSLNKPQTKTQPPPLTFQMEDADEIASEREVTNTHRQGAPEDNLTRILTQPVR